MTTYNGTLTGSGTLVGTGALSGVTEDISQADVVTADLTLNADGTFTGTEDQVITTTVTIVIPGVSPTTTSSTYDSGAQQISGNVNTPNTYMTAATGNTETTTWQFSSNQTNITVTGTDSYNSADIAGSYNIAGTLSQSGAGAPNLVFTSFSSSSTSELYDGGISVSYTIKNEGTAAAASQVDIYFSTSPTLDTATATLLGQVSFGALAAGNQITENIPVNLNSELQWGSYYIFVYVNDNNDMAQAGPQPITITQLFTPNPIGDQVNFNELLPNQQLAIIDGANKYDGLGGNDTVILPYEANETEDIGDNETLGWTDSVSSLFHTSSLAGQTYTITGFDGDYWIACGAGSDNITINQDGPTRTGSDTIVTGSGHDTVNISGNGNNLITVGIASPTIYLNGYGNNIVQVQGADPPAINGIITTTANPNIENNGSFTFKFLLDATDSFDATLSGDGEFIVQGGTLVMPGANSAFTGDVGILSATLELAAYNAVGSGPVSFLPAPAGQLRSTLQIDGTTMPSNVIIGFVPDTNETIDLRGVGYTSEGSATLLAGNVLEVIENSATYKLQLDPNYDYTGAPFVLSSDNEGGTDIGNSQPTVYLPTITPAGAYTFDMSVMAGQTYFIDPSVAAGYSYASGAGNPNFASVLLPAIQTTPYTVSFLENGVLEADTVAPNTVFAFPTGGVNEFTVTGVDLADDLNPANATAFVTGLTFVSSGAFTGTQTPIVNSVPIALFQGLDASGVNGLWATNGTAAGTYELTGISGASTTGLNPSDLTVFNNEMLFAGKDASGQDGLWVTNGMAAGTQELTGISGAFAGGILLYGGDLTVFNNEVLFGGLDASGANGLWVTNGTAAGTHELTGISGARSNGIFDFSADGLPDFTVFNNEVLFAGLDAGGNNGLWVTNGTAAGTHELTGVTGASTTGLGLNPSDLTVFNNEVLFEGKDASGQVGLWMTNGTAAGTHELTGISGAFGGGILLYGGDLTVFNNEVLFGGLDASGANGLWVTNGTAAGTHELTGISGARSSGIFDFSADGLPHFAVFNNEVLFAGLDASGNNGLWVTNGTAAGTHELTGISGASTAGLGLNPSDLTVFNNEVLFEGKDASGQLGLWVTNGTAAGTNELTGISGVNSNGLNPSDITPLTEVAPLTFTDGEQIGPGTTNPGGPLASSDALAEVLYVAYFERAGDPAGVEYWVTNLNKDSQTIDQEAISFGQSQEAFNSFQFLQSPASATTAQIQTFIESIYGNLFNRQADTPGLNYWTAQLEGYQTELQNDTLVPGGTPAQNLLQFQTDIADFIMDVVRGAQNSAAGQDITTIIDKVTVASYFTEQLSANNINYANNLPATVDAQAHSVVANTDSTAAASVTFEEAAINAYILTDLSNQGASTVSVVGSVMGQSHHI